MLEVLLDHLVAVRASFGVKVQDDVPAAGGGLGHVLGDVQEALLEPVGKLGYAGADDLAARRRTRLRGAVGRHRAGEDRQHRRYRYQQ